MPTATCWCSTPSGSPLFWREGRGASGTGLLPTKTAERHGSGVLSLRGSLGPNALAGCDGDHVRGSLVEVERSLTTA